MPFPTSQMFTNAETNVQADPLYLDAAAKARVAKPHLRDRLANCARSDPSHIKPLDTGPQVAILQLAFDRLRGAPLAPSPVVILTPADAQAKALNAAILAVQRNAVSPSERSAGSYGPSTAQLVLAYKQARNIRRYPTAPVDNIVGTQTIQALDSDLAFVESGSRPKPPSGLPFATVTFSALAAGGLILKQKLDSPLKADLLDTTPVFPDLGAATAIGILGAISLVNLTVGVCELTLRGFVAFGGSNAIDMATYFIANKDKYAPRFFADNTFWSNQVRQHSSFVANHAGMQVAIRKTIAQIAISRADGSIFVPLGELAFDSGGPSANTALSAFPTDIDFGFQTRKSRISPLSPEAPLAYGFGRIQGVTVELTRFNGMTDGTYEGSVRYTLFDHYGTDPSDIIDPGQVSLYLLQRRLAIFEEAAVPGARHKPFRSIVIVEDMAISGNLLKDLLELN